MADYTDTERDTIRTAAFGAMALVSKADPGFFAMFKESMAGSRALSAAPPEIGELLRSGGFPSPPTGDAASVEAQVLGALTQARGILGGKDQAASDAFREVILAACDQVAQASDGVAAAEQAVIDKVRAALD